MIEDEICCFVVIGVVVGLCLIIEFLLGDGIFNGMIWVGLQGCYGFGLDSNICILLIEEMWMLEYSQCLCDCGWVILVVLGKIIGCVIYDVGLDGGVMVVGCDIGVIRLGLWVDFVVIDIVNLVMVGCKGDQMLDSLIFFGYDGLVIDIWLVGCYVVKDGRYMDYDVIIVDYMVMISCFEDCM